MLLTVLYAIAAPVSVYKLFSSRLEQGVLSAGVLLFFIVFLALNRWIARSRISNGFSTGELAVVFAVLWLGASSFQLGVMGNMLGVMSAPEYFASAENRWAEFFHPHLKPWASPSNEFGGVRQFYNGLPPGGSIPWGIWAVPLLWWGSLIAATLGVIICLMTIVHEQWHEHEKLTFPLADVPLALIGREVDGRWETDWYHSPMFWIGAAVPLLIVGWNTLNWFNAQFPHISFTQDPSGLAARHIPSFSTRVDVFALGLAYFAPLQILRGMWLGWLVIGSEITLGNKFGFGQGMNPGFEPWSDWGTQTAAWQCLGSLVLWVLWSLWMGRIHLKKVARSAFGRDVDLPDNFRRRYSVAAWGLLAGLIYMAFWFHEAGMAWTVVLLFLPMILLLTLGMAKVIVESCFLQVEGAVSAQTFVMQTLGTSHIPEASMTALVLSYVLFRSNYGMMMPQVAFAGRLGDERGVPRGRLYLALGLGVFTAIAVAVVTMIVLGYDVGAFNFGSHPFRVGHIEAYETLRLKKEAATGPDYYRLAFFGIGMVFMAAVLAVRARFAGFWLHPVGLTYATAAAVSITVWNIFLAWAVKSVLIKIGGIRLVNRVKPMLQS